MKIFGLGLSKTGTSSLDKALTTLGYTSIHYPCDDTTFNELVTGQYRLTLLNTHDAITDITPIPYYRQLDQAYDSKFIVTVRDKEEWLKSTELFWNTILINGRWNEIITNYVTGDWPTTMRHGVKQYLKLTLFLHAAVFGTYRYTKDCFSRAWDDHMASIENYFQGRTNLLVMNIFEGDGWPKLCAFLNKPIPNIEFPHENKRTNA